jgi:hypothetical protein
MSKRSTQTNFTLLGRRAPLGKVRAPKAFSGRWFRGRARRDERGRNLRAFASLAYTHRTLGRGAAGSTTTTALALRIEARWEWASRVASRFKAFEREQRDRPLPREPRERGTAAVHRGVFPAPTAFVVQRTFTSIANRFVAGAAAARRSNAPASSAPRERRMRSIGPWMASPKAASTRHTHPERAGVTHGRGETHSSSPRVLDRVGFAAFHRGRREVTERSRRSATAGRTPAPRHRIVGLRTRTLTELRASFERIRGASGLVNRKTFVRLVSALPPRERSAPLMRLAHGPAKQPLRWPARGRHRTRPSAPGHAPARRPDSLQSAPRSVPRKAAPWDGVPRAPALPRVELVPPLSSHPGPTRRAPSEVHRQQVNSPRETPATAQTTAAAIANLKRSEVEGWIAGSLREFERTTLNPRRLAEQSQRSLVRRLTRERERLGR